MIPRRPKESSTQLALERDKGRRERRERLLYEVITVIVGRAEYNGKRRGLFHTNTLRLFHLSHPLTDGFSTLDDWMVWRNICERDQVGREWPVCGREETNQEAEDSLSIFPWTQLLWERGPRPLPSMYQHWTNWFLPVRAESFITLVRSLSPFFLDGWDGDQIEREERKRVDTWMEVAKWDAC